MRHREVLGSMLGAVIIYVAMAACSGAEHVQLGRSATTSAGAGTTGKGGAGHGGASGVGGAQGAGGAVAAGGASSGGAGGFLDDGGLLDAIADAITDPVSPAKADPVSGNRLKARYRTAADGAKEYINNAWYDDQLNQDCNFMTAGDGVERCLPGDAYATNAYPGFTDAGCSKPVTILAVTNPAAGCAPKTLRVQQEPFGCGSPAIRVYNVGPPLSTWYTLVQGVCSKYDENQGGATQHFPGVEVPPQALVAATVDHDP